MRDTRPSQPKRACTPAMSITASGGPPAPTSPRTARLRVSRPLCTRSIAPAGAAAVLPNRRSRAAAFR